MEESQIRSCLVNYETLIQTKHWKCLKINGTTPGQLMLQLNRSSPNPEATPSVDVHSDSDSGSEDGGSRSYRPTRRPYSRHTGRRLPRVEKDDKR